MTLNGTASWDSAPASIINYTWTFTDVTTQTLKGKVTTYTFATPDIYIITLNVTNAVGEWDLDTVVVTVVDVTDPVADAGSDQTVDANRVVTFNGSASADNVGIESYVWSFMEYDSPWTLTGVNPYYIFVNPGNYTVTLKVTDAAGNWDTDTVTILVRPTSGGSLPTWDIVLAALAIAAIAIGILSLARRGSK